MSFPKPTPGLPGCEGVTSRLEEVRVGNAVLGYFSHIRRLQNPVFHRTLYRLQEIDRLLEHRHGQFLPETNDVEWILPPIAALFRVEATISDGIFNTEEEALIAFRHWTTRWMPWVQEELVFSVWSEINWRNRRPKADTLAIELAVTMHERTLLKLTQIGACDIARKERLAITRETKRTNDRLAKQAKRRKAGSIPREQYEAESVEREKPWVKCGISRSKYYRDLAKIKREQIGSLRERGAETGVSPVCNKTSVATHQSHSTVIAEGETENKKKTTIGNRQDHRGNCKRSAAGPKDGRSPYSPGNEVKTNAA
ncbi:MAG: hypothetical protein JJ979_07330 [Roseibium sp.]|nr:hypothetical protein [Roseibium sp.]